MKRYAVLRDQVVFNETEKWFNKKTDRWVEQKSDQDRTVRALERKYGVKLQLTELSDGQVSFKAYKEVA